MAEGGEDPDVVEQHRGKGAVDPGPAKRAATASSAAEPPKWRRRALIGAGALALAATAALLLNRRAPEPFPAYSISFEGGATVRAQPSALPAVDPSSVVSLGPGAPVRVALRPATAVRGEVRVRTFVAKGRRVDIWDVPTRVSNEGVIEIDEVRAESLPALNAAEVDLVFVVAPAGGMLPIEVLGERIASGAKVAGGAQILRLRAIMEAAQP